MSTTEAKYMAVAEAAKEALWLTGLVREVGVEKGGVRLHCDSQSAIYLANNQVYHARTKHIDVRFHKIRELLVAKSIVLLKVHTSENAADMLTKPVTSDKFKHCLDLLPVNRSCFRTSQRPRFKEKAVGRFFTGVREFAKVETGVIWLIRQRELQGCLAAARIVPVCSGVPGCSRSW